jgi:nucleoside-triphosphatase
MGRAILLAGRPGVGKTTVIRQVVDMLGGEAGGFYTEEIRQGGRRVGFKIITLEGEEGILAHVDIKGAPRVSKYGVNIKDLEEVGVAALRRAIEERRYVVIDEIGKMELYSQEFRRAVAEALESEKVVLGTVMAGPHGWVDTLKARPQVTVLTVTQGNRDAIARRILDMLQIRRH